MRQDFSIVPDLDTDRVNIPPGRYLCRVRRVDQRRTRDGASTQWGVMLEVVDGPHAGAVAAWDNLTFSDRGLPRVKLALRAFGFDVSGILEIEAHELEGRQAFVEVVEQQWENAAQGATFRRLGVPYSGYSPVLGSDDGAAGHGRSSDGAEHHDSPRDGGPEGGGGPGTAAAERLPW